MQKRVLSLVLVLCMLLTMVPALALSVFAEEATATVTFVDGDTTVSTQVMTGATLDFTVPEVPSDAFGWYVITSGGVIREASTYLGAAAQDVTFRLLSKKSTFSPTTNWPLYTSQTSLDGYRGGWTAGSYINNAYSLFNVVDSSNILRNWDTWGYGGIYLTENRMIAQKKGMLALSYNAPANGVIDVDFEALRIDKNTDGCVYSDISMAIAINGVIVWPASAADQKVKNNPVSGTDYTFPYFNQVHINNTVFTVDIKTDWAYFELLGQEVPKDYTDLSDLTVEALGFDYTKYLNSGIGTWNEKLAAAQAALKTAQTGNDTDAIAKAQAAVDAAQADVDNWNKVNKLCRPVTEVAKTGDLLSAYEAYCEENGFPHDLAVKAGDRVDIVFNRVNNPHITAYPTVTYDKVTSTAISEDTVFDDVTDDLVFGGSNYPITVDDTAVPDGKDGSYVKQNDFGGGWSFIGYNNGVMQKQYFSSQWNTYGNWVPGILWIANGKVQRTGNQMTAETAADYGAGYAYTAKAPGTLNMDLTFNVPDANASRTVYFAIYKFAATGTKTVVYEEVGYNTAGLKNVTVKDVTVSTGDSLALVWRISDVMNYNNNSSPVYIDGTGMNFDITYTKGGCVYQSVFDPLAGQNKPINPAIAGYKVTYTGGWDLVSHAGLTKYTPGESIDTVMNDTGAFISTGFTGGEWDAGAKTSTVTNGYAITGHSGWPDGWGVYPMLNSTGGWRYTAEYDGVLSLNLTKLVSRHYVGDHGYVAVFHNGKMIWPMAEGVGTNYYGDYNKWAVIGSYKTNLNATAIANLAVADGSAKTGSLAHIAVAYGDEIEILVRNDKDATGFWNDNSAGFICTADVAYSKKSGGIMFNTRLDENLPAAPAADKAENFVYAPVFRDPAWSFVNFPKEIITKENAVTKYLAMNRGATAGTWNDGFWGCDTGENWGYSDGRNTVFRMFSGGDWGPACGIAVNDRAIGGYRYTAPSAGKIDIDITKLWTMATNATVTEGEGENAVEVPKKNGAITVAIFVDCQKVWPAGDDWYVLAEQGVDYAADVAASIDAALTDVIVGDGSTIDFLVDNPYNYDAWTTRGTVFEAAVTYKEQYPVFATGAVSVGDSFTFKANATTDIAQNIKANVVTVAAKDVCNKFAYTVTGEIGGKTVTLATGVTTMKDALMAYVTDDANDKVSNMAIASLNYAAAAQKYFAVEEIAAADLANAGLTDAQKKVNPAGGYTAASRVATVEGAQAQLIGISLLLEDKIALKLVFNTKVEGAEVQMADNAEFTGATEVAYTATDDKKAYKAITDGIGAANYNSLIYIRVVNAEGTVISNTIAYSVTAYCQNMKGTVGAVADAILALYDAADAYKAS